MILEVLGYVCVFKEPRKSVPWALGYPVLLEQFEGKLGVARGSSQQEMGHRLHLLSHIRSLIYLFLVETKDLFV